MTFLLAFVGTIWKIIPLETVLGKNLLTKEKREGGREGLTVHTHPSPCCVLGTFVVN